MPRFPAALVLFLASCAPPLDGEAVAPFEAGEDAKERACAFDAIAFDPSGGLVLQAANDVACVRLERAPLAAARRGTEWQAVALDAVVDGETLTSTFGALQYANSHHNCLDVVTAAATSSDTSLTTLTTLTIDGANQNPDVCFSGAPEEWRLVLSVNGATHVLAPHVPR